MTATDQTQDQVAEWFDRTYSAHGFGYLRPVDAYPIYLQLLGAEPGQRLLDVACGPGRMLEAARLKGLVACGADISRVALGIAGRHVPEANPCAANAEALPFADDSFDLITCIGSLERFLDRRRALAEMQRVARPGARFCLMVRNASTPSWRVWRQLLGRQNTRGHQDAGTLQDWRTMFAGCGFAVDAVHIDQWFRQKLRFVLRGFRRHDFRRPERVARPLLPLRWANEFIFVLRVR